jgi:hypothetical protein
VPESERSGSANIAPTSRELPAGLPATSARFFRDIKIAGQPIRFAVNPQYNFIDNTGFPGLKVSFSATLLLPGK